MKSFFRGFYQYTDTEFKDLWKDCKFILDTNVLTHLYLYSKETRDDLLEILNKISGRLWIPYQVALEFQENRISAIAGQKKELLEVRKLYSKIEPDLVKTIESLQLRKRHSPIDGNRIVENVKAIFDRVAEEAASKEEEYPEFTGEDKLRDVIDTLFKGKIGPPPQTQADLEKMYKDGEIRYKWDRPPGYKDNKKPGAYFQNGLCFVNAYGDLLIWKQIIEQAKKDESFKKIIFVTNDEKEDWWWIEGNKTIGPRPELIDEIYSEANTMFYMYSGDQFLKYAKEYLAIESKLETAKEIKEVSEFNQVENGHYQKDFGNRFLSYYDASIAASGWLRQKYKIASSIPITPGGYFVVIDVNGMEYSCYVIYSSNPFLEIRNYSDMYIKQPRYGTTNIKLLVIVDSSDELAIVSQEISRIESKIPWHLTIGVGLLRPGFGDADPYLEKVIPPGF